MNDIGNHPEIENALRTGYPHGEPNYPHCPVCGEECEEIHFDRYGAISGCDGCTKTRSAWEVEDCF